MLFLKNDYSEGAHPKVLEALQETNFVKTVGYGLDEYCQKAEEVIKATFGCPDADVHFITGGTIANTVVIASVLKPYQGVICVASGHINVHESGAIEATGHKIIPFPSADGKLTAEMVETAMRENTSEHMVEPALVYISNATELGTVYTKAEIESLSHVCRKHNLCFFIDGARLAQAVASPASDLELIDFPSLCDIFYIGGTKNGILFGEAIVITNDAYKSGFRNMVKRQGGMLAKGRVLGVQFLALFEDGLFMANGMHAVKQMSKIVEILQSRGFAFLADSPANMSFPIFTISQVGELESQIALEADVVLPDGKQAVRFVTSWATSDEDIAEFERIIDGLESI